jgi:hypothetical protein
MVTITSATPGAMASLAWTGSLDGHQDVFAKEEAELTCAWFDSSCIFYRHSLDVFGPFYFSCALLDASCALLEWSLAIC